MRRALLTVLAASAAISFASPASATLHGFCNSGVPACTDNGSNTPTTTNPPNFGFYSSPGGETGTYLIDILIPNNLAQPSSFTLTGLSGGPFTASLFSGTAWTSGELDDYIGLNTATPVNPIGAFIQPNAGQTGWWVYQANLGTRTLPGAPSDLFTMLVGGGGTGGVLPLGSYIVGYLSPCSATANLSTCDATANSGAIRVTGVPEPATWAMMLLGFTGVGAALRRRRKVAIAQLA
jgi:hypothetical protein